MPTKLAMRIAENRIGTQASQPPQKAARFSSPTSAGQEIRELDWRSTSVGDRRPHHQAVNSAGCLRSVSNTSCLSLHHPQRSSVVPPRSYQELRPAAPRTRHALGCLSSTG